MDNLRFVLFLIVFIVAVPFVFAGVDLVVRDIELLQEPVVGMAIPYRIYVQNAGDELVISRLAVRIYTNTDSEDARGSWFDLASLSSPIQVIAPDGSVREEIPAEDDVYLFGEEVPIKTLTVRLYAGETAVFNSVNPTVTYSVYFVSMNRSLEGEPGYVEAEIDPHNEITEDDENNLFRKDVLVGGGIVQGPFGGSGDIPSLDENEYFVSGQGCALIREKRICVGDETIDGEDVIILSVDDEERRIERFHPLFRWIVRLLLEGRESPSVKIGDLTITLYTRGFKVVF